MVRAPFSGVGTGPWALQSIDFGATSAQGRCHAHDSFLAAAPIPRAE